MIRINTASLYDTGVQGINADQIALNQAITQLSSGKQINSPSDNPAGAAQASLLQSDITQLGRFQSNQGQATQLLNMGSSTLTEVVNVVQQVRQTLVQAGDPTYDDTARAAMASQLQQQLGQLVGLANSSDGQGGYLFAGSQQAAPPFTQNGTTVSYAGDRLAQGLQISATRSEQVKYPGAGVFNDIPTGNGTFLTGAASGNAGTGTIDAGSVSNPAALTGDSYAITFGNGGSTYSVQDTTTSQPVAGQQNIAYTSPGPATVAFAGMQMTIAGAPQQGDTFTVAPSSYQSLFATIAQGISALQIPSTSAAVTAQRSTALTDLIGTVDQALTHLSTVQSSMGAQLSELGTYTTIGNDRTLQDKSQLSSIVDLDYAKGVTQLQQRQTQYQAALQSYSAISKLSLFNYL